MRAKTLILAAALSTGTLALAAPAASTVVYALPPANNVNFVNPIFPSNLFDVVNVWASQLMYKPLLWIGKDLQVNYARSIARSVRTQDGQHYLITLKSKWHWSDGKPVTAADVAFELRLFMSISEKNSSRYGNWGVGGIPNAIRAVQVLGPRELEITLKHPYSPNWFILNGIGQLTPLPKRAWDRYPGHPRKTLAYLQKNGGNLAFFRASPIDGPYRLVSALHNAQFVYTANSSYGGHRPQFHHFVFRYFTSSSAEFNALATGQIQIGYLPFHLYGELPRLQGFRAVFSSSWGITYIYPSLLNPAAAALKDLAVRQALQMAVDQPAMVKAIYHGQALAQYGPVPYQPPTYVDPLLAAGEVPYPYDPAAGRALLERAGWKMVDGVMRKGAQQLSFTLQYASGSTSTQQVSELFAAAAAKEGIRIHLEPKPFDALLGELATPKSWELMFYGNGWVYNPYPTGYGLFGAGGGSNSEGYASEKADQLISATHAFTSPAQALKLLYRYQDYLAKDLPVIYLPEAAGAYTGAVGAITIASKSIAGFAAQLSPAGALSPQYWTER
jgi:peptide/nickel transport system substrate-binding protein